MVSYRRSLATFIFLVLFGLATLGGLLWANMLYVQHFPAGRQFEQVYQPARAYLVDGFSPFTRQSLTRTQVAVYGREATDGDYPFGLDIPFPLFAVILPFGLIGEKDLALAVWMLLVELAVLALPLAILRAAELAPRWPAFLLLVLLSTLWPPSLSAIVSGSIFPLVLLSLVCAVIALQRGSDELAGMLLALSMMRLEWLGPLFALVVFWVISQKRWRVLAGWGMTMILLNILAFIFLPSWPLEFIRSTLLNLRSGFFPNTFEIIESSLRGIGQRLAQLLLLGAVLLAGWEWVDARYKHPRLLFWAFGLTGAILPFTGLPIAKNSLLVLLPGLVFGAMLVAERWRGPGVFFSTLFGLGFFAWSWWQEISGTFIPNAVFLSALLTILLLYWIRWWINQPRKFWADLVAGEQ